MCAMTLSVNDSSTCGVVSFGPNVSGNWIRKGVLRRLESDKPEFGEVSSDRVDTYNGAPLASRHFIEVMCRADRHSQERLCRFFVMSHDTDFDVLLGGNLLEFLGLGAKSDFRGARQR